MRGIQECQLSPRTSWCSKRSSQSRSATPPSKVAAKIRSRSTADQDAARCLRAIVIAVAGIAYRRLLHGHGALEHRLSGYESVRERACPGAGAHRRGEARARSENGRAQLGAVV